MMISKFHKLIQSKVLWIAFSFAICVAFIGAYLPSRGEASSRKKERAVGRLYGELVQPDELRRSYTSVYLGYILDMGTKIQINEEINNLLEDAAWVQLAAQAKAKRMGIAVTDKEVAASIRNYPLFHTANEFDPRRYKQLIQQWLPQLGFTEAAMENMFRNRLISRKLAFFAQLSSLVRPEEIKGAFHRYQDKYKIEYAVLQPALVAEDIELSSDDLKGYYTQNKELFRVPPKRRLNYVRFEPQDFFADISVTDEQIETYYNDHLADYVIEEVDSSETNEIAEEIEYRPLEEVSEDILAKLRKDEAKYRANKRATDFAVDLTPDRQGRAPTFSNLVAEYDLEIHSLPPLSSNEPPAQIGFLPEFNQAAFKLNHTPDEYFSNPIKGSNAVYVIELEEKLESFIPEYDLVVDEVRRRARNSAIQKALHAKAEEFRAQVSESAEFAELLAAEDIESQTSSEFRIAEGYPDNKTIQYLLPYIEGLSEGSLSKAIPYGENILLALVSQRELADTQNELPALRSDIVSIIKQQKSRLLLQEQRDYLLADANFEDLSER